MHTGENPSNNRLFAYNTIAAIKEFNYKAKGSPTEQSVGLLPSCTV